MIRLSGSGCARCKSMVYFRSDRNYAFVLYAQLNVNNYYFFLPKTRNEKMNTIRLGKTKTKIS